MFFNYMKSIFAFLFRIGCSSAISNGVRLIRYKVDSIQSCVESTLDVYRNRLPFVLKLLCIESKPLKSVPDCIALWDRYNMADG